MKPLYVKKNGVVYKISGAGIPSIYPAANVEYDNTVTSELQATDVQGAIDELSTREAGVQSDWDEDDTSDLSYIQNKPENLVQDASYVHTDNNYDATAKDKVDALGTASTKDVPVSGNASTTQVVMGNDTRLTDARSASDVSAWAKADTKPTYTASEVGAIASTLKGAVNGVAELDAAGKVPSSQLPSFVDDVIEVADYDHLPITGESGKIYVTLDTNKTYRWTGSGYAEISESLALGETSSTAYRGDRGKIAYDHATETKLSTATTSGLYKVAATAQGHISSLTAVEKSDITALGIPAQDTTYGAATTSVDGLMSSTDKAKLNKINEAHYLTGVSSTDKIKININSTDQWMLSFVVSIYQSYRATRIQISGYNIGNTNYWYQPEAVLISDSDNDKLNVYFGYDSQKNLWVGFDGGNYTGVSIDNVTNGHKEVTDYTGLFTISRVATLETIQKTLIPYSNHYTESPTASQVLIASSANGGIKTSGYTIAKSVPSDAVFTDTNNAVTQTNLANTDTNTRRIILSGSANDTSETKGVYKNTQLLYTPSTGFLNSPKIKATINNSVLTGTGTAAQDKGASAKPRYFPAKWQFNTGYNPSEGDIITITLPVAGHGWGDWISINNGSTWHPANFQGTGRLTTHFSAGQVVQFVFDADGSTASMTPVDGANSVNGSTITGGCWRVLNMYDSNSNTIPSAYCDTAAATAAKAASCSAYALLDKSYVHVLIRYANTSASAITMNINGTGAKAIYINGTASSASNYTLPAGTYLVYYASNIFYFRTDGKITGDITGNAATVNGLTVQTAVPSGAKFTDTNNAVTQTATTTDAIYEVLFSATADNTTRTEGARKTTTLRFNPSKGSLMEGTSTTASGQNSHAEGISTTASGFYSHAEGYQTAATSTASHAEGYKTTAAAPSSSTNPATHAEGYCTLASGINSHAEGRQTTASGAYSHAEGQETIASGTNSHVEGYLTIASGAYSHAEGRVTTASGQYSHAEGYGTCAINNYSHAEGDSTTASGKNYSSHAEGYQTRASGSASHAEGFCTTASGAYSHAEGKETIASGNTSRAEGNGTSASGTNSHAEGWQTAATSTASHAEGYQTKASSYYAHSEGNATTASGSESHAEGNATFASNIASHAEGYQTRAPGNYSHAEGSITTAYTVASHAEGAATSASGNYSHAEGIYTTASNTASHSSGHYNVAMTTGGNYNNTTGTAFVIGNGTAANALKNAFSVQFNGVVKAASTITASTTADYAEYFEWADENLNNEDRVGYFVTFDDGDKIRFATSEDDYILGVTSGEPFVLGNGDCDVWNGMVLRDEFRRIIYEPAPEMIDVAGGGHIPKMDKDGNPVYNGTRPKLNPNYDPSKPYINRADRPEWCPVGMLGVLAVRDDGTCEVNGYATITDDATATKYTGQNQNKYRVIHRNTQNVVEIVFR